MGSWVDLLAFTLTFAAFLGVIYGVHFVAKRISATIDATKESLKDRGYTISDKGVSVRTSSRYTREDYVDATQRGIIKAMGASSFNKADLNNGNDSDLSHKDKNGKEKKERGSFSRVVAPVLTRHTSSSSVNSVGSAANEDGNGNGNGNGGKKRRLGLRMKNSDS